jgi:hypothetical protein
MRHPPRGLLLAAVAGPVVLLGAGPAAADQTPADPTPTSADQTADATAGAAGTTGEPGTPGTTSADSTSTSGQHLVQFVELVRFLGGGFHCRTQRQWDPDGGARCSRRRPRTG